MTPPVEVFAFGGGVQSVGAMVLASQGRIRFRTFLFANVGDDSEDPETLEYLDRYAKPFAREHGLQLREIHRRRADGSTETLYGRMTHRGSKALPIPVRFSSGVPASRTCTADFKIKVVGREVRRLGASRRTPAIVGVGISVDEIERANNRRAEPYERVTYPLLELGLRRTDCAAVIRAAGLPVPPKSSCWFCPFRRTEAWRAMRRDRPHLFHRAARLEGTLTERRLEQGKDAVFLTDALRPLEQAFPDGVLTLPVVASQDEGSCDGGWCWT